MDQQQPGMHAIQGGRRLHLLVLAILVCRLLQAHLAAEEPVCPACAAEPPANGLTQEPWVPLDQRRESPVLGVAIEDQHGTTEHWKDLAGRVTLVSFIFSRCSNPNKCPRVASAFGDLARRMTHEGLPVRLALVTYDPAFDSRERLSAWVSQHGEDPSLGIALLRPQVDQVQALVSGLGLGVSFNATGVSVHDIELLLLDKQARCAHRYHTQLWNEDAVVADVKRLVAEPDPAPAAR
jgi:cytochrome oxidase Cu insertion factor (SCO1/SenC/PrrC family)